MLVFSTRMIIFTGNAAEAGLLEDLRMTPFQLSIAISIFYGEQVCETDNR